MLIIVAIVLLIVLPSPWNVVGFGVGLALGIVEIFGWNQTVKRRQRVVGAQTLIGRDAVVVAACRPDGQVRIDGELWAAHCDGGASPGDPVRIVSRNKLVLTVEPEG
jgi:membrane protein implicated in regulation of membrane protease activity